MRVKAMSIVIMFFFVFPPMVLGQSVKGVTDTEITS
jgi:dolichyl-phosphate-mannose--protein O-mannosyl transferase